jgi:putative ABC transport system permease protein
MLLSYLKIAWRNLLRNRTLSLINLIGLSISVAFCVLLFFHIRYEQSFDRFHRNGARLYRMEMSSVWADPNDKPKWSIFSALTRAEDEKNDLEFPLVVGRDLAAEFPEVDQVTRFKDIARHMGDPLVRADNKVYKEPHALYADANFFQTLSFPLLKGDSKTVLALPGNVVLSASVAKKYFGDRDPIGMTIELANDSNRLFRVSGVAADAPANSSIQYSFVLPLEGDRFYARDIGEGFNRSDAYLIVELKPGVNEPAFMRKVNRWMRSYFLPETAKGYNLTPAQVSSFGWWMRPLADGHFNASEGWGHFTDVKAIYQIASIAVVILLLASLNYVLIAVSNAASRSQEIGVRKVMGAGRGNVILQFWVETQLIVGMAVLVGMGLAFAGVPLLKGMIGSGVTRADISWGEVLVAAVVLAVLLGLVAGYYPAMLISRLKPVSVLKNFSAFRVRPRFARVLVVIQFTCCVVLMMAAFVIERQMDFVNRKDLGFDKDQVLIVHNQTDDRDMSKRIKAGLFAFARTQPAILASGGMSGGLDGAYNTNGFKLNGQQENMREIAVDYSYFEMLGLKIVAGRNFSPLYALDTMRKARACVVNEAMWKLLGKEARLGVYDTALRRTVIGVVKDYHFESLSQTIQPQVHVMVGNRASEFLFKVRAGQMRPAIAALGSEWKRITNNYPFEYTFLDQSIAQMYAADMRWRKAIELSCGFAILIACMGLFGLAAISAANRTKEIGIRKVLGASVGELAAMMSRGFLGMVGLSFLIAMPLGWWLTSRWLESFAYRIELSWWMFGLVGLVAVVVAMVTIGFQVLKVARANPVKALRAE